MNRFDDSACPFLQMYLVSIGQEWQMQWMLISSMLVQVERCTQKTARLDPCDEGVCTIGELTTEEWAYDWFTTNSSVRSRSWSDSSAPSLRELLSGEMARGTWSCRAGRTSKDEATSDDGSAGMHSWSGWSALRWLGGGQPELWQSQAEQCLAGLHQPVSQAAFEALGTAVHSHAVDRPSFCSFERCWMMKSVIWTPDANWISLQEIFMCIIKTIILFQIFKLFLIK